MTIAHRGRCVRYGWRCPCMIMQDGHLRVARTQVPSRPARRRLLAVRTRIPDLHPQDALEQITLVTVTD
jgi:hypothetical protein